MTAVFLKIMRSFVAWLDPKLERFRPPKQKKPPYTPKSSKALIELLKRTPESILSATQRTAIASAMSYQDIPVSQIMAKTEHVVTLHEDDILGALTLDRLYKTGLNTFPVLDQNERVCGILRTDSIDTMRVVEQETKLADCIDRNVCFVRADYSLDMLLSAFLRTNNNFCIVIDHTGEICGYVSLAMFILRFFGSDIIDNFELDADKNAVLARREK